MAKSKLTTCSSCGSEISKGGKVTCPKCGKVNKKPIHQRAWFLVLCVLIVFAVIGSLGEDAEADSTATKNSTTKESSQTTTEQTTEAPKEAIVVTVDTLVDVLHSNALKASSTYKGAYVELTGKLIAIDSAGDYISLGILSDEFSFDSVNCSIKKEHLDKVMEFETDQEVTVVGTITEVGEVLGYFLDVEFIK